MLWTKEAQRQGNCDDNDGGCVDPIVFQPALGTYSVVVMDPVSGFNPRG